MQTKQDTEMKAAGADGKVFNFDQKPNAFIEMSIKEKAKQQLGYESDLVIDEKDRAHLSKMP